MTISWGDGSANTTLTLAAGVLTYSASHQYLDDNPTGTASDSYTIGVTVKDDDLGSASASTSVTVNNVAPTITSFTGTTSFSGPLVFVPSTFTTTFTDPGTQDTFRAEFNWGDGSPVQTVAPFTSGQKVDHLYTTAVCGRVVTVKVIDDDTGSVTATTTVNIGTGGFQAPMTNQPVTNKLKNGQVLPVKIQLTDCNGVGVHRTDACDPARCRRPDGDARRHRRGHHAAVRLGRGHERLDAREQPERHLHLQHAGQHPAEHGLHRRDLSVRGSGDDTLLNTGYTLRHVIQATK